MLVDKSKDALSNEKSDSNNLGLGNTTNRSNFQQELRIKVQEVGTFQLPPIKFQKLDISYAIPLHAEEGAVTGRPSQPPHPTRHPISGMIYFGPTETDRGDVKSQSMIDDLRKAGFTLSTVATYQIDDSGKAHITGWRLEASKTTIGPDGKPRTESYSEEILVGNPPRKEPTNNQVPTQENLRDPLKKLHSKTQQSKQSEIDTDTERSKNDHAHEKEDNFEKMIKLMMEYPTGGMPFDDLKQFLSPPPTNEREWKLLITLLGVCEDPSGEALGVILSKISDPDLGHCALGAMRGILDRGKLSPEAIEKVLKHLPFLLEFLEEEKAAKGDPNKKASRLKTDLDTGLTCGEPSLTASNIIDLLVTDPRYASAAKQKLTEYAKSRPSPEKEQLPDGIANIEKAQKLGLIPPSVVSLRYLGELVRNRESPEQDSRPVAEVIYSGHDPQGAFTTDSQRNIEDLIRAGYKVVVHKVNNEDEMRSALQERARMGGADLLFVIGHGTPNGIRLGGHTDSPLGDPSEEFMFGIEDNELNRPDISGAVKPSGTVVLHSCSTGKTSSESSSRNMGRFMREIFPQAGTVIAPDADIPGMIFEFDPRRRVSGAKFEDGNAVRY